jgi:hypothetical protein
VVPTGSDQWTEVRRLEPIQDDGLVGEPEADGGRHGRLVDGLHHDGAALLQVRSGVRVHRLPALQQAVAREPSVEDESVGHVRAAPFAYLSARQGGGCRAVARARSL